MGLKVSRGMAVLCRSKRLLSPLRRQKPACQLPPTNLLLVFANSEHHPQCERSAAIQSVRNQHWFAALRL
jgi:hypothetical protein